MTSSELNRFTKCALRAVEVGGTFMREYARKPFHIEIKADGSPVTSVDQAVEDPLHSIEDVGKVGKRLTKAARYVTFGR